MNINLAPDALSALQAMSETQHRSPDDIIADLILSNCHNDGIDEEPDPQIIALLDARMADIRNGEKCYSWDEAKAEINSWFTDSEKSGQQCQS